MKGLILAAGKGERLNNQPTRINKCMIKINGKPVIAYSLECAAGAGVEEIVVVVGYRAEDIINTIGTAYKNTKIRYVIQWKQEGLVHAIECAREALAGEDFLLILGDEIMINPRDSEMIKEYKKDKNMFGLCGVLWTGNPDQIRKTYTLDLDGDNRIRQLVEKPGKPFNNYQGTGHCVFNNKIFEYMEITPINPQRNQKELPDLIQTVINKGNIVKSFLICDRYVNINAREDIRAAEEATGCSHTPHML
jgi:dTDP-glucose pyrophosphorylase